MTDEPTKADLQDELRRRDLPVSGTKAELQQRLDDADREREKEKKQKADKKRKAQEKQQTDEQPAAQEQGDAEEAPPAPEAAAGDGSQGGSRPPRANEIARLAVRQLGSLTRHTIEGISGLAREGAEWRVDVEVLEVSRVPPSTDVLATYAVWLDSDGELVSYERVERFVRGQASGGEG